MRRRAGRRRFAMVLVGLLTGIWLVGPAGACPTLPGHAGAPAPVADGEGGSCAECGHDVAQAGVAHGGCDAGECVAQAMPPCPGDVELQAGAQGCELPVRRGEPFVLRIPPSDRLVRAPPTHQADGSRLHLRDCVFLI